MAKKKGVSQKDSARARLEKAPAFVQNRFNKLYDAIVFAAAKEEPRKQLPKLISLFDNIMVDLEALEDKFRIMYKGFVDETETLAK